MQDAVNRTARGVIQGGAAATTIELLEAFEVTHLTQRQFAVLLVTLAGVYAFVQNLVENKTGRAFLKRVPEEPLAAEAG